MKRLAISLVLYNNDAGEIGKLIHSIRSSTLQADLFVVDNSPRSQASLFQGYPQVQYFYSGKNIGYGSGHNLVMQRTISAYEYHLVVNPDIYFEGDVLQRIAEFMDSNPDVGHLMPKILFPDGRIQYLRKNLPRPWHLAARRILPRRLAERWNYRYEMRYADYQQTMEAPFLSGCFMFFRAAALRRVGIFDQRYFLYFEDLDLTRRIGEHYRCIYYPEVAVFHNHKNENQKNLALLFHLIKSSIQYFNRYGWRPLW